MPPKIDRDGDSWAIAWDEHGVGIGVERLRERSDGLRAEITVQSTGAGRVQGPNTIDLLSARSQAEFANACAERVNGLSKDVWRALVVHACALVAREFRAPQPSAVLAETPDTGPVEYLVPYLMPTAETTVMYGDGESGKSMLAVRIGVSVASGQDVPWGHEVRQANVLYLDWETNQNTLAKRFKRVCAGMCIEPPVNFFYRQCFRSITDELPHIREEISRKHIGLVIVDSIGFAASGALVEDETARSAMNALRQMSPATRLVVAHVSKSDAISLGPRKPFGSAFFWNGMRSGVEVSRSDETQTERTIDVGVFHRKSNDGPKAKPIGVCIAFDGQEGPIMFEDTEIAEVADLAQRTPLSSRIRALLKRGAMTTNDLADELEAKPGTIATTLRRMDGIVQINTGGGRGKVAEWGLSEN